uniref:Uncharacterized protein n=1 Tax=Parascaris univalens TaxID=6257 RepID=A0A915A001_PARUN
MLKFAVLEKAAQGKVNSPSAQQDPRDKVSQVRLEPEEFGPFTYRTKSNAEIEQQNFAVQVLTVQFTMHSARKAFKFRKGVADTGKRTHAMPLEDFVCATHPTVSTSNDSYCRASHHRKIELRKLSIIPHAVSS